MVEGNDPIDKRKQISDEITIFTNYGADIPLARSLSASFKPSTYSPKDGNINDRIENAETSGTAQDYLNLSYDMLLVGNTIEATKYMKDSINLSPLPKKIEILENIVKVQKIITGSMNEFNKLREDYKLKPLESNKMCVIYQ